MASVFRTKALILRHTTEREVDRMLSVLTPEYGLQRMRARGTKKSISKLGGSLEPLSEVDLMVANGRVIDLVTGSILVWRFPQLRTELVSFVAAQWLLELLEQVTRPNEADPGLYALAVNILREMEQETALPVGQRWLRLCRRAWYILRHQGFAPSVTRCSVCQQPLDLQDIRFHARRGFLHPAEAPPDAITIAPQTMEYLRGGDATDERVIFRQVHALLEQVLHQSIERPLRSEPVLRAMVRTERLSVS